MTKEREQASFNSREMTYFMDGGESVTKVNTLFKKRSINKNVTITITR